MSSSDLRDRMDGLQWDVSGSITKLETIMPGSSIITYSRGENVSADNINKIIQMDVGPWVDILNFTGNQLKVFRSFIKSITFFFTISSVMHHRPFM